MFHANPGNVKLIEREMLKAKKNSVCTSSFEKFLENSSVLL
jgi:hypothetical protein